MSGTIYLHDDFERGGSVSDSAISPIQGTPTAQWQGYFSSPPLMSGGVLIGNIAWGSNADAIVLANIEGLISSDFDIVVSTDGTSHPLEIRFVGAGSFLTSFVIGPIGETRIKVKSLPGFAQITVLVDGVQTQDYQVENTVAFNLKWIHINRDFGPAPVRVSDFKIVSPDWGSGPPPPLPPPPPFWTNLIKCEQGE